MWKTQDPAFQALRDFIMDGDPVQCPESRLECLANPHVGSRVRTCFCDIEVLLTTEAAIRTKERGWIHASRIKGPVDEPKEWTITSEPGDTKLTLKRGLGGFRPSFILDVMFQEADERESEPGRNRGISSFGPRKDIGPEPIGSGVVMMTVKRETVKAAVAELSAAHGRVRPFFGSPASQAWDRASCSHAAGRGGSLIYLLVVSVLFISLTLGDMGIYMTDFDRFTKDKAAFYALLAKHNAKPSPGGEEWARCNWFSLENIIDRLKFCKKQLNEERNEIYALRAALREERVKNSDNVDSSMETEEKETPHIKQIYPHKELEAVKNCGEICCPHLRPLVKTEYNYINDEDFEPHITTKHIPYSATELAKLKKEYSHLPQESETEYIFQVSLTGGDQIKLTEHEASGYRDMEFS
ncbi:hypothetical protein DUI87_03159 [Hirundo rustica rustica]|uniref:Uncharacterized protein n=1 Tax=Hirundo rustica rustica TaxID=333673 RepID=A0A3M0L9B2_HIRRU|nr:hypothetical protein DUI87_03159 [Hirundo rustica rustica]